MAQRRSHAARLVRIDGPIRSLRDRAPRRRPLAGQSTTGSISGDVTDSSRTLASGVTVTATSLDTGLARSVTTDQRGHYRVVDLRRVAIGAGRAGRIQPAMQHDVVVTIGSDVDVDLSIEVAALVETVEVTARSTLLDTKATSVGGIVTTQQIGSCPQWPQFPPVGDPAARSGREPGHGP